MTEPIGEIEVQEPEVEVPPLETLQSVPMADGLDCYIGNVPDVMKTVDHHGIGMYYILANRVGGKQTNAPRVFKRISNILGDALFEVTTDSLGLDDLDFEATFALPKIPHQMVEKMDKFFRLVAKQKGTESIVVLTYNPKLEEKGWGLLVPEQTNTGSHCHYDAESLAQDKPDDAFIVGSVHSHPNMPAYASGTDHEDQADFDGLHITYGWQDSKENGKTQYHAELQMGGTIFTIEPKHIFEPPPEDVVPNDVQEMAEKVDTKKSPVVATTTPPTKGQKWDAGGKKNGKDTGSSFNLNDDKFRKRFKVPPGYPNIDENLVVAEIDTEDTLCPVCKTLLLDTHRARRRCSNCATYLFFNGESVDQVIEARKQDNAFVEELESASPIMLWVRSNVGGGNTWKRIDNQEGAVKKA